jgi:hypothetical protein
MPLSRAGRRCFVSLLGAGALWRPATLLITSLTLGACSSAGVSTQSAAWYASQVSAPVAVVPPALPTGPQVEIEGDGLEGQLPPRRRAGDGPDNPREPFSPNYGAKPAPEPSAVPEPV